MKTVKVTAPIYSTSSRPVSLSPQFSKIVQKLCSTVGLSDSKVLFTQWFMVLEITDVLQWNLWRYLKN